MKAIALCRLILGLGAGLLAAGQAVAQADWPLRVALVNDSETVFDGHSAERNLGFRLGLEYALSQGNLADGRIQLEEFTIPPERWESNQLPDTTPLSRFQVWVAPVQARKAHRILQYADHFERLVLVPATPATDLPVADYPLAFRTFYRWRDVDVDLLDWATPDRPIWVSAVNSDLTPRAGVERLDVSPRSTGASALGRVRSELAYREQPALVSSWPVLMDWLPVLAEEYGLTPERTYLWLPDLGGLSALAGHAGINGLTYYYYDLVANPVNDWLVEVMLDRHGRLPSHYIVAGMTAALALTAAVEDFTAPPPPRELAGALAGLAWNGPQGQLRMRAGGEAEVPLFRTQLRHQPQLQWARPVAIDPD